MRAVWYDRQGAADEVLVCGELPTPEAGHGEVRVKLEASGVNPSDTYRRRGPPAMEYRDTPPPGTMPSSTAARVAWVASSTRSFFSLTSTSAAPPTRITATPPARLSQALLQLLAVVIRGRLLDLLADLRAAALDVVLTLAEARNSGRRESGECRFSALRASGSG
jgi:hypothetical protein